MTVPKHTLSIVFAPNRLATCLLGKRFGQMLVLQYMGSNNHGKSMWLCGCTCGNFKTVVAGTLTSGHTLSCGCSQYARSSAAKRRHGQAHSTHQGRKQTAEYTTYCAAKKRCNNPKAENYPRYGGRGIKFLFTSFEQFYAELGDKPTPNHSIDRIDNNGHYEPGNVRWATDAEQRANKRSH